MPRDDRAHGVHSTKKQKAGNGRRKASRRKASGTRKLADKGK
jgi:hypothetical protein